MDALPLSEVKARLSEIAEEVDRTHRRVNITRDGRTYLVLMSAQDLESLEATLELLSDPEALRRLAQAETDLAEGQHVTQAGMAAEMEERSSRNARPGR